MSMKLATAAVILTIVCAPMRLSRAAEADDNPLATLRPGHPRLFVTPDRVTELREAVKKGGLAKDYFRALEQAANAHLDAQPAKRVLTGPRLLFVSRATLKRLETLGVAYLVTGERRYADRAIKEMRAVAAFSDWNPSHFLDVAEMSAAMGIGYDWFYDAMSDDDRKVVREAIVKHAMKPGLEGYAAKKTWARHMNNWAQVCNGGLTIGALAIADAESQVARDVIVAARDALKTRMHFWAPDGGFVEGPGYWGYATMYAVYYLAALETALGSDFGYSNVDGFAEAGVFRIQSVGSSGLPFNYADAGEGLGRAPQMFWMARRYDRPEYAANERRLVGGNPDPFDLIWLDATADATTRPALPTSAFFRGVNVATFRNTWNDTPDAIFVAVKGGDNKASHGHLDLGSFVLDFGKRRWVSDTGPDDYNLPAYFGKLRWTYYHCNTEGQNTLMLDGENQALDAKAQILVFADKSDGQLAVVDLSAAYTPKAKRVRRGVGLGIDNTVIVQDEIEATQPLEFAWGVHTNAKVELSADGLSAVMTQGDERLHVTVGAAPVGARLEVKPVAPPPPQRQHKGMSKLILRSTEKVADARIVVYFSREPMKKAQDIRPLDGWIDFARRAP